jgi:hypothetical protein
MGLYYKKLFVMDDTQPVPVFPAEEVLAFDLWREPLEDPGIRVFVAVESGYVVDATEYRYYEDYNVAVTDFTIVGKPSMGIGRFLYQMRLDDLLGLAAASNQTLYGMFAEIYDPYRIEHHAFGGIKPMDPFVRREVLSHQGYKRLDFSYVHPSWINDGQAVEALDFCFLPFDDSLQQISTDLIVRFLKRYYAVLDNKPQAWNQMIKALESKDSVDLLPI